MTLSARLLDSIASAAVREGLADAVYTRLDTPIGKLLIVQGERGVVRVGFPEESVDALLAQVAAHLGPRIVASDRELSDHARRRLGLLRRRRRAPGPAGRPLARALGLPPLGADAAARRGRARATS